MRRRAITSGLFALAGMAAHAQEPPARDYDAVLEEGGRATVVGRLRLDRLGRMTVVSATPDRAAWLTQAVRALNAQETIRTPTVPPAGSPRFANASRIVPRNDPSFIEALRGELKRSYELELR